MIWEVQSAIEFSEAHYDYLEKGWEPFTVLQSGFDVWIYFRRVKDNG